MATWSAGYLSYRFSKTIICFMFAFTGLLCLLALRWLEFFGQPEDWWVVAATALAVLGSSVGFNCPKALLSLETTEKGMWLVGRLNSGRDQDNTHAGTMSGVIGLIAQLGCSFSGSMVGSLITNHGWQMLTFCQIISGMVLLLLLVVSMFAENATTVNKQKSD
jgi:sugar phosphate permease